MIVPKCQQPDSLGSQKLSKATVLQKCKWNYVIVHSVKSILLDFS